MFSKITNVNPIGKWVIVTGCDSGFGYEVTQDLVRQGFGVIAGCLTQAGQQKLVEACPHPARLRALLCDVTRSEDLDGLVSEANKVSNGSLWGLINNAGIVRPGHTDYQSLENYRHVMEVNYFAVVALTTLCMPMLKRGRGRVVNITSTCGIVAVPTNAPYNGSKYALEAFSDTLRRENSRWGIKVAIVEPGCMRTALSTSYGDAIRATYRQAPQEIQEEYGDNFIEATIDTSNKGMERLLQDPAKAISAICHAISSKRPQHRYRPGLDTKFLFYPLSIMPSLVVDPILNASNGFARPQALDSRGTTRYEFRRSFSTSLEQTYEGWLNYLWKEGCKLPFPLALLDEGDTHGKGCTRKITTVRNFNIQEGITETQFPHRLEYKVLNLSWPTFPANFHKGEVQFLENGDKTELVWRIDVTPKALGMPVIWLMLHSVVPIYLYRLEEHLNQAEESSTSDYAEVYQLELNKVANARA